MGTKKWYLSKTVWSGILSCVVIVYNALAVALQANFGINLPHIPNALIGLLSCVGIYSRVTATTTLTK